MRNSLLGLRTQSDSVTSIKKEIVEAESQVDFYRKLRDPTSVIILQSRENRQRGSLDSHLSTLILKSRIVIIVIMYCGLED